jgi:hypothetical protein
MGFGLNVNMLNESGSVLAKYNYRIRVFAGIDGIPERLALRQLPKLLMGDSKGTPSNRNAQDKARYASPPFSSGWGFMMWGTSE